MRLALRLWALLVVSWVLADGYAHLLAPTPGARGGVAVYSDGSVEGLPRLGVLGFRTLGLAEADTIVVAAHAFEVAGGGAALGVDVLSPLVVAAHPLMALTGSIVAGWAGGRGYVAVTPTALAFSRSLDGKAVVLVVCGLPGVGELAEGLARMGARLVAYYGGAPCPRDAASIAEAVARLASEGELGAEPLRALGFEVLEGSGRSVPDLGPPLLALHAALTSLLIAWGRLPRPPRRPRTPRPGRGT